jgi:uncharacterized membrane protein YhaH (DUF805 family)
LHFSSYAVRLQNISIGININYSSALLMVARATLASVLVLVAVIVVAAAMYVTRGVGEGFEGVPRLLAGHPLYDILNPILALVLFVLLGLSVYYVRRVRE